MVQPNPESCTASVIHGSWSAPDRSRCSVRGGSAGVSTTTKHPTSPAGPRRHQRDAAVNQEFQAFFIKLTRYGQEPNSKHVQPSRPQLHIILPYNRRGHCLETSLLTKHWWIFIGFAISHSIRNFLNLSHPKNLSQLIHSRTLYRINEQRT
jgi:hypothetical protein